MMSGLVGQIRVWVLAVIAVALLPASVHAQTPGIYVTPDGGSAVTVNTNTSGYTAQFTVEFIGSGGGIEEDFEFINLSCSGQLGITCSVSQSSVILMSQQTASITVTFNTSSSTGSAQVRLYASGTFYSDDGYRNYTVQSNESVAVTALSVPTSVLQYTDSVVATYRVQRTGGSGSKYFSFACTWGGGSCTRSPTGYSIAAGGYKDVTVTFDAGDIPNNYTLRLDATATGLSAYKSSTVAVSEFVSVNAVATRSPVYVKPNVPDTIDLFSVRFPGQTGSSFSLSVNCSGGIAGCSVAVATTVSVGDTPVVVPVRFTGGANGNQSTITLTATKVGNSAVTASESLEVVSTNQIILTVDDANPGLEQMRGECLNISAGPGAIVCDDYQFVYPFTPVTRMNKTRQIGLIYNSSLIAPWGVVGANFVVPPGPPEPDSVKATLVVNGTTVRTQSYPSSAYQPGEKRRIAFDWSWSGVPDNTQVVPFTISLEPWVGGVAQTPITASHHLISLNKRFVFGRGWWLAGYENVVPRTVSGLGNVLVWTGGDTSGRVYLPAGTNRWVAWSRSRPDTITTTGSEYVRKLIGGGEVRFNSSGYHTKTVDRNGNETIITHGTFNGHVRPTSIQLPTSTGPETVYQLQYDGATGQLEAVQVISATGAWDTYNVHTRPYSSTVFFIDSISAPDGLTTRFETSWGFLDAITDPLGVRTAIGSYYQKVRKITVQSSDYPDIVMWYQPATTLGRVSTGYWGPRVVEDLYSYWDGPRTDVSDISRFFVTGWGAIRGTRDALGNETWIDRGDTNYPAFPTRVRHANGRQVL
ncbi:MAG: hypothetical protein OEZ65_16325, partial [Gemmatimonadota bacterium]|nr:hypothetical protein [Gemmatimonadota bacterium]